MRDEDDAIDLDNPQAERGLCWSCQRPIPGTGRPVALTPDLLLPVCPTCWSDMTVAERLTLAIQFDDRSNDKGPLRFHGRN